MKKHEYFLTAVRHGAYQYKSWIIECFGIVHLLDMPQAPDLTLYKDDNEVNYKTVNLAPPKAGCRVIAERYPFEQHPYQLFKKDELVVFFNREKQDWDVLQGAKIGAPFFDFKEEIEVKKGVIVNANKDCVTWIGNVLVNQMILVYPFGDIIPFVRGRVNIAEIEDIIARNLLSIPEDDKDRVPNGIYGDILDEYYYFSALSLAGLTELAAPAATPYTLVTSPEIRKLRKKLLEENIDKLDDPTVIAGIMKQLIEADKEFCAKDPEKGFLEPGKMFDVVRAKSYLMYGIEFDFEDRSKVTLIEKSLSEGWDITKLPEMVNSIVDGSYSRGKNTALGGEAVKFIVRFFLNCLITEDDCGSQNTLPVLLTKDNLGGYLGSYIMEKPKMVCLENDNAKPYLGKVIQVRTPLYCNTKDGCYCLKCLGQRFENSKTALAVLASEVGSILMDIFMQRMHGVALKVEPWDIDDTFL